MYHTIYNLLEDRNTSYTQLVEHARELAALTSMLDKHLPASLSKHCQLANYRSSTLVIQSESAAWAAKLRYLIPQLQQELVQYPAFSSLTEIRVRVAAPTTVPREKTPAPRLSEQSAQLLKHAATTISDPVLGKALSRLARHKYR